VSGLPGSVYCARHGLNRKSFYRWRKVAAASRDLVPVELSEPEGSVRIWVGDVAVEVDAGSSPEAVRVAVQGLSGLR